MKPLRACILFCTALPACASIAWAASAPGVALVRDGRSEFVIHHAPSAPKSVQVAARELQHYVEKTTGAKLPISATDATPRAPFIALGDTAAARAAGISAGELPAEGFRFATGGGNVFIVGSDTADGARTREGGTSHGTRNGVYSFIEDALDVRWLLPGELGEDAPRRRDVIIAPADRRDEPAFRNRRLPGMQRTAAVDQWSDRQKLGFSLVLEHAHSWHRIVPASMHDQHPDWFAEIGGQRPPAVGDRYKVETTNPAVVEHFAQAAIAAFRRNPQLTVFSLSPTDSGNWSTSAESRALYDRDPHGRLSVTPLILKFYNDVAKIVGREFPDRKLAGYIYASYLYPPSAGVPAMEPNLFIVVAPSISYGYQLYRDSTKKDWDGILRAWSSQTSQIAYYDMFNWLRGNTGAITPPAPDICNFAFPRLKQYGMKGVYLYGTPEWSQAAVNNYVLAKMAWDPSRDAHALCAEFHRRAYGEAAAKPIAELYRIVEKAVSDFYNRDLTANYTATPRYMSEVLAANYDRIEGLYLEAIRAATAAKAEQRARLEFFGDNLVVMQWQLRANGMLPDRPQSPLHRTDGEVEKMMGRLHPGFGVALAPGMKRAEKSFPPARAAWLEPLPNAQPVTPLALRGVARFLFFPKSDHDIRVTAKKISSLGSLVRCDAYSANGAKVAGGVLRPDSPINFLGGAGQVYYVEVNGGQSFYELDLSGAPYALAANSDERGIHIQGKATPLYFRVPAEVAQFTITTSSSAPGETSLSRLFSPDGKLIQSFDTQTSPVTRVTIRKQDAAAKWDGFWCLLVGKAPKGVFDDVWVALDPALPQWYVLNPAEPLAVSALETRR